MPDMDEHPSEPRGPRSGRLARLKRNPRARVGLLAAAFTGCAITIAIIVGRHTGGAGLAVGAALALIPAPVVVATCTAFGRVRPLPWRTVLFVFAWGSCAAALIALLTNNWTYDLLNDVSSKHTSEVISLSLVAPLVEEAAKGAAVLIVVLTARRWFLGPLDGLVVGGVSAAGFAFTENILYFGRAYNGDLTHNGSADTGATFVVRGIMSPFAHPLFTSMTGIAIGFAVARFARGASRANAVLTGLLGYLLAAALHSSWNSSALGGWVFAEVYFIVMLPLLGAVVMFAIFTRRHILDAVRAQLPRYAAHGWFAAHETAVLGMLSDRSRQVHAAQQLYGQPAAEAVRAYQWDATAVAEMRQRAVTHGGWPGYAVQERVLLERLAAERAQAPVAVAHTLPSVRYVRPQWVLLPVWTPWAPSGGPTWGQPVPPPGGQGVTPPPPAGPPDVGR